MLMLILSLRLAMAPPPLWFRLPQCDQSQPQLQRRLQLEQTHRQRPKPPADWHPSHHKERIKVYEWKMAS